MLIGLAPAHHYGPCRFPLFSICDAAFGSPDPSAEGVYARRTPAGGEVGFRLPWGRKIGDIPSRSAKRTSSRMRHRGHARRRAGAIRPRPRTAAWLGPPGGRELVTNVGVMCRGGGGFRFAGTHQHTVLVVRHFGAVGVSESRSSSPQGHTQRHHERHNQDRDAPDHKQVAPFHPSCTSYRLNVSRGATRSLPRVRYSPALSSSFPPIPRGKLKPASCEGCSARAASSSAHLTEAGFQASTLISGLSFY